MDGERKRESEREGEVVVTLEPTHPNRPLYIHFSNRVELNRFVVSQCIETYMRRYYLQCETTLEQLAGTGHLRIMLSFVLFGGNLRLRRFCSR